MTVVISGAELVHHQNDRKPLARQVSSKGISAVLILQDKIDHCLTTVTIVELGMYDAVAH